MLPRPSGCPRCGSSAGCSSAARFNAFFTHGEAQLFLARRDGRVVGRISAQIDHAYNEFHGSRWGMFGFLELEDDQEVADALLAAAEAWLRERGRDRMVGPMDFTMNDESGDRDRGLRAATPMIRQPWHPPYYQRLCERRRARQGDGPADVGARDRRPGEDAARSSSSSPRRCEPEHGITLRHMSPPRACARDMDVFAEIYNEAWAKNWGFVPYDKEDLDAYAQELQLVFDPRVVHGRRAQDTASRSASRSRCPTSTRCCAR